MKVVLTLKRRLDESLDELLSSVGLAGKDYKILRLSIDSRKKPVFVYKLLFDLPDDEANALIKNFNAQRFSDEKPLEIPKISAKKKVLVVGAGPAGLFAARTLALSGFEVVLIDRGKAIEERQRDVERFWVERVLDENSNVQFGEGGAGAFSDGKLTSRSKSPVKGHVLKVLSSLGAPEEILYLSKPHIGTDRLKTVIRNFRENLKELGVKIMFSTLLKDMRVKDGKVLSVLLEDLKTSEEFELEADFYVLAVGNAARDTFKMLLDRQVVLEKKPFAVGLRIVHPQKHVNRMQYKSFAEDNRLPPAEYSLSFKSSLKRGVFTFCMCPGGVVICSSSEKNAVVTNGMSNYNREGPAANSALVVQVFPEDFSESPLGGVEFQRSLEKKAFKMGGGDYSMPAQSVRDFLRRKKTPDKELISYGYIPQIRSARLDKLLPDFIYKPLKEALSYWLRRFKAFSSDEATLIGVETRTSSPVRILRDESLASVSLKNLFPAGEGSGYAGGIVSSAVDGVNVALSIAKMIRN